MQRRRVDAHRGTWTMGNAGGEDTALLRSNRSAHAGAETQAGGCQSDRPLSLFKALRFRDQALNPGVWGGAPRRHVRLLGHMSSCGI